jgi:hypothetical protein
MEPYQAVYQHAENRFELRHLYLAYGIMRGRSVEQIESKSKTPYNEKTLEKILKTYDHNEIIKKQKESYKQSYLDFSKAKVLDIHGEVVSSPPTSAINNDAELRNYISLINTSLKAGINKITIPIEDPEMIKKIRESVNAKPGQLVFHAL